MKLYLADENGYNNAPSLLIAAAGAGKYSLLNIALVFVLLHIQRLASTIKAMHIYIHIFVYAC